MVKLPLEGIRVIDITMAWAGPFGTQILADLGAEVIKVENIHVYVPGTRGWFCHPSREWIQGQLAFQGGYPDREPGARPWNRAPNSNPGFRNKYSMTVDLRKSEGMAILKKLVKVSDVFMENNVTETMEKLGITYEWLKEIKQDIIYCRMPAYGLTGIYKNRRAWGAEIDAFVGHSLIRGYRDSDPSTNTLVYLADYMAGVHGAFAVLAALHHRNKSGKGQLIDVAMSECALPAMAQPIMDYTMNQRISQTIGNRDLQGGAPYGVYRCKGEDRWICICISSEEEWYGLCHAMGNPSWTREDKFSDTLSRYKNQDELDRLIGDWTVDHDNYALMHILQKEGVSAGAVLDARDVCNDSHLKERYFFEQVTQEDCGTHWYPGQLYKLSKTPLSIRRPPVRLGEDNEYVYKQVIGVTDEEYAELEKWHIGMDFDEDLP